MTTKLYRSEIDKMLGGVCGGLGRYLGIDPTIVRLFFVLLTVANGVGVFIYFVLWLIVPGEDQAEGTTVEETIRASADEIAERARALGDEVRVAAQGPHPQAGVLIGALLIVLGVMFLLQNLSVPWLWWLKLDVLWPALLVLGGVLLLRRRT